MTSEAILDGQTAIVTGAARGIGAAIATRLAAAGARVIATDVLEDQLEKVVSKIGARATASRLDVTEESIWAELVAETLAETGRIDILINNAGILAFSTLEDTDPKLFRKLLEVNVTGSFLGMRAVIPAMKAAKSGAIVNMSSSSSM